ncbi:hypothetical protein BKA93DRAFT_140786 [Sparassis latifolia]
MGQRHQAFVIARVRSCSPRNELPKYRCIAAYHNQWCYGRLPLRATHRFLTLVKQKENAEIVRAEIRTLNQGAGEGLQFPAVPCPFTAFLLGASWDVDLAKGYDAYFSGVTFMHNLLSAEMGCWDNDNDDGISVIDVTDPEHPAYCFVNLDSESNGPLSAEQYVRIYHAVPKSMESEKDRLLEEDILAKIALLDGENMVTLEMLAEAWPDEFGNDLKKKKSALFTENDAIIPSLATMSLAPAVDHAIKLGDTSGLETMLWLPGKIATDMKALLQEKSPFPDAAVSLLVKIVRMVSQLERLESLNLSFNPRVTADTIREILSAVPGLKRLVLMGCPAVEDDDLYKLMRSQPKLFYRVEALMHPSVLTLQEPPPYPITFSFMTNHTHTMPMIRGCSLPLFTPAGVVNALTDVLRSGLSYDDSGFGLYGATAFQAAATGRPRAVGVPWGARSVVALPTLDVDVLMDPQPGWAFLFNLTLPGRPKTWCFLRLTPRRNLPAEAREKAESSDVPALPEPGKWEDPSKDERDPAAPPTQEWEMHDLHGFVRITTAEGRPAPSEEALRELEDLLRCKPEDEPPLRPMTVQELNQFLGSLIRHKRYLV